MIEDQITIRGARENNLKDISLNIPSQKFIVITGPSGSGKSSLAFDTIFAEGQRRYLESLSSYARQFLDQLSKPDVDFIDGLSPSIAIEQKTISNHPRSTVGTVTNIYDFVRLLFAKCGEVKDPGTGETLSSHSDEDIIDYCTKEIGEGKKFHIFASVVRGRKGEFLREFEQWRRLGFSRVRIDGEMRSLHDPILISKYQHHDIDLLIDTLVAGKEENKQRVQESLKHVDRYAEGWMRVEILREPDAAREFSRKIASASGQYTFPELEPRLFSFNSPYGMCKKCKGLGSVEIKKGLENAEETSLTFETTENTCEPCGGSGLRQEALWVEFCGKNVFEYCQLSAIDLKAEFEKILKKNEVNSVAVRVLTEINSRLQFLDNVGVAYLSLGRKTNTLSGGEAQRIRLATQLGSLLSGVLYVLDEPSIGLHPIDHEKLLKSLLKLRDSGNTVIVVEHDEETMLAADHIIDIGPGAGVYGGELIDSTTVQKIMDKNKSITGKYLSGNLKVYDKGDKRPLGDSKITISGCTGHNLNNVTLDLPLGNFVVFTGVSGSGKSSLVRNTLEMAISKTLYRSSKEPLPYKELEGLKNINKMVHVDQKPIGRTPRSNPATYTGLFSTLRNIFAQTPDAQIRGYNQGTFSFNIKGGRCDGCEGAGRKKIEMHFLPNVFVECEVCSGSRYRREVLEVRYKGKNIAECLAMSVTEAHSHFKNQPLIEAKLKTLLDVGLGYIKLGQPSTTLSGGEAQRIKLAKELSKRATGKTIYFLDEPTTGLHFNDIAQLLKLLHRLCDQGNTVVVIEHNTDVVASADHIIDIGPGPGGEGGEIVYAGVPEKYTYAKYKSPTSKVLNDYFKKNRHK